MKSGQILLCLWGVDFGGSKLSLQRNPLLPISSNSTSIRIRESLSSSSPSLPNKTLSFIIFIFVHIFGHHLKKESLSNFCKMGIAADESQFHVLAVDDSLIDRTLIERLLKRSSYQVTTVDSGSKALEFLGLIEDDQSSSSDSPSVSTNTIQEVEVNLVITDYCMPGMTGYDLLKRIKESSALRDIPVVIMSSENVPSRINRCLEEGADEFFLKPVRLSDVHRLKPHLMRNKSSDHHHGHQSQQKMEGDEDGDQEEESSRMLEIDAQSPSQPHQMHQLQHQNINKRKSMEEGLSPDRTRLRLNDVAAVV